MEVFADTLGLYALLDADDRYHQRASAAWTDLATSEHEIVLTNFVFVEVWTLLQARLGFEALEVFLRDFFPLVELRPVSDLVFVRGMTRCRVARRRHLSLTDCIGIEFAKERGVRSFFAFDPHFREAGFSLPPSSSWLRDPDS